MSMIAIICFRLANLECEVLGGLCKRVNFYPGLYSPEEMCKVNSPMYHYWNKIRLSRRWYLVDVSLSQQGCSKLMTSCNYTQTYKLYKTKLHAKALSRSHSRGCNGVYH